MSNGPAVSVVMPAFNEASILDSSVRAVVDGLRARGIGFELVIVENGSDDGTLALANALATELPEVRAQSEAAPDYGRALRAGFGKDAASAQRISTQPTPSTCPCTKCPPNLDPANLSGQAGYPFEYYAGWGSNPNAGVLVWKDSTLRFELRSWDVS
jgi:glycosyltransferase involved in cell wall biosynthesis